MVLDDNAVLTVPSVHTLQGRSAISAEVLANGALRRLEAFGTSLLLHPATVAEAGLTNLHLRLHQPDGIRRRALLGPGSGSTVVPGDGVVAVTGHHEGLDYRLLRRLGDEHATWHWDLDLTNTSTQPVTPDVVLTHHRALAPLPAAASRRPGPALAPLAAVRPNAYFVSRYRRITPVCTQGHGSAVSVRQS